MQKIIATIALTGVPDESGTTIVPGAYAESFVRAGQPKVKLGPWGRIGKAKLDISVFEMPPGHEKLPKVTPDGAPWPEQAGALGVELTAATDWTPLCDALESGAAGWYTTVRPIVFADSDDGARTVSELDLRTIALKAIAAVAT